MVSTYPASIRLWVKKYLKERDGDRCAVCGRSSAEVPLEIDHFDGAPGNWDPSNPRLLCHRDNVREYWRRIHEKARLQPSPRNTPSEVLSQAQRRNQPQDNLVADCSREKSLSTAQNHDAIDMHQQFEVGEERSVCESEHQEGMEDVRTETQLSAANETPEMRVNREKEPLYRAKCLELILRPTGLTVDQAVHEVAEIVQISPVTARRYLKKIISEGGPLMLGEGPRGYQRLLIRESYWLKSDTSR